MIPEECPSYVSQLLPQSPWVCVTGRSQVASKLMFLNHVPWSMSLPKGMKGLGEIFPIYIIFSNLSKWGKTISDIQKTHNRNEQPSAYEMELKLFVPLPDCTEVWIFPPYPLCSVDLKEPVPTHTCHFCKNECIALGIPFFLPRVISHQMHTWRTFSLQNEPLTASLSPRSERKTGWVGQMGTLVGTRSG